tara:strand:+ start:219 stop:479 length:261 start_codon:yes stop_codon:yes gene_type:complete
VSKATFFTQAFNGIEVGSHIPESYYGDALYEGIKEWGAMGYAARSKYLNSYIGQFGPVGFIQAAVFPAPCQDAIKVFFASQTESNI